MLDLNDLLQHLVEHNGSDLHVKVGSAPYLRVDGHLVVTPFDPVRPADTDRIASSIMPPDRAQELAADGEADFALSMAGLGRFRVNVFRQRGSVGLVIRRVLPGLPPFDTLGLPAAVRTLADEPRGLVLVTAPPGSGCTTTVAALVDHINERRAVNIVTIEDPIEVLHPDKLALVNQREIGTDTRDYPSALRRAMRQDPDVIVLGQIPDAETMAATLSAASTGHLVVAAMTTGRAVETVRRVLDVFPPLQHRQTRVTLAACLRGIVSQALVERADGRGRIPAVEVLVNTPRVFDVLSNPDSTDAQLEALMAEGEYYGMQTFDQSLLALFRNGLVSDRDVLAAATHPTEVRLNLEKAGTTA